MLAQQAYDVWGYLRLTGRQRLPYGSGQPPISQTGRNFTGQELDGTGLLFYHARYYDPGIGRFVSADSVVPGNAGGGMDGVALKGLTVDFHEPGFAAGLAGENNQPFWFHLSGAQRQRAGVPWGPANPQALNRYSYVLNNPLRYTDPGGHALVLSRQEAVDMRIKLLQARDKLKNFTKEQSSAEKATTIAASFGGPVGELFAALANAVFENIYSTEEALATFNWLIEWFDAFADWAVDHPNELLVIELISQRDDERCTSAACHYSTVLNVYFDGEQKSHQFIPNNLFARLQKAFDGQIDHRPPSQRNERRQGPR